MDFPLDVILKAHEHCMRNREAVEKSSLVGCFYCERLFQSADIAEFCLDVANGSLEEITGVCPYCSIDSLIGDASGFPVSDPIFLKQMKEHWFGSDA